MKHNIKLLKYKNSINNVEFVNISFQIDLINTEITPRTSIVNFLNENSIKVQHLLEEDLRLVRWWFENLDKALLVVKILSEEIDLSYRLISIEKNILFIQVGNF